MEDFITTIKVRNSTRKELKELKIAKLESYNEVISRLLKNVKKYNELSLIRHENILGEMNKNESISDTAEGKQHKTN